MSAPLTYRNTQVNSTNPKLDRILSLKTLIKDAGPNSSTANAVSALQAMQELVNVKSIPTLSYLIPIFFNWQNKPVTLHDYRPVESLFRTDIPKIVCLKAGRQIGKSFSQAMRLILLANALSDFKTIFVTPLFEQVRRFSSNYVRSLMIGSPLKNMLIGTDMQNSVLQKTFRNRSSVVFTFTYNSPDRARGLPGDCLSIDEIQDVEPDHIDVLVECLSASKLKLQLLSGTPKGADNAMETHAWGPSSQGEWTIRCLACRYINIPSRNQDLDKMIGPVRMDISDHESALLCAKCRRPLDPRNGRIWHAYDDRKYDHSGLHLPQVIFPMHCCNRFAWADLLRKREQMAPYKFDNEVLGETSDTGGKPITEPELRAACTLPWTNADPDRPTFPMNRLDEFVFRVLGVDWGGQGGSADIEGKKGPKKVQTSYTSLSLIGMRGDGSIEVLWGKRIFSTNQHDAEAQEVCRWHAKFRCHVIAHDYTGAGTVRETILLHAGFAETGLFPMRYQRAGRGNVIVPVPPTPQHNWLIYQVDKARMLLYICQAIKWKLIRFFEDDLDPKKSIVTDFLALVENNIMTRIGDIYTITREASKPDDFAQATSMAIMCAWYLNDAMPNFAEHAGVQLTAMQQALCGPPKHDDQVDWEGGGDDMGDMFFPTY